jgi:probable regulatory domain-containing protein
MSENQIPLNPVGRQDIHKLETILLTATLLRPEVLDMIRTSSERLTWVDSLAVAAGALAREKAGMTLSQIAEELGRTEQTVKKHLKEESKAGQLVKETYEIIKTLIKEGKDVNEAFPLIALGDAKGLKEEVERLKKEKEEIKQSLAKIKEDLETLVKKFLARDFKAEGKK